MDHGASLIDARGYILQVDRSFSSSLAHELSELIGANIFSILPEGSAGSWRYGFKKAAESSRSIRIENLGSDRNREHNIYPVANAGGEYDRYYIVSRDITEMRLMEKERDALQAQLLQR